MTPPWVARSTFVLALVALVVSAYLTIAHFTTPAVLACANSGVVNCARVTTSAQSRVLGIPVAVLGLGWSIAMVGLCSPPAWASTAPWIRIGRVVLAVAGIAFVLWLVYAELFVIRAICLWCTVVHLLTFALFVIIVSFGWAAEEDPVDEPL
jgi:uncharacterized membrane protein